MANECIPLYRPGGDLTAIVGAGGVTGKTFVNISAAVDPAAGTVATVVNDAQDALLASELLGHTDPRITMQHYIQRNETVDPVTAEHLERAFGKAG